MRKHFRIFCIAFKNSFVRELQYPQNFLTGTIVDIVWIVIEMGFFEVLYSHVDKIAGWTRPQVYFFLGLFFASDALMSAFVSRSFWEMPRLINRGDLDLILTKPANPVFLLLCRSFALNTLLNVGLGLFIISRFYKDSGVNTAALLFFVPLAIALGFLLSILIRLFLVLWAFWLERGTAMNMVYYQAFQFASKPDTIYPNAIRYVMLTVLPFAFIASVPARFLIHGPVWSEVVVLVASTSAITFLSRKLWRAGLRRYQSASS